MTISATTIVMALAVQQAAVTGVVRDSTDLEPVAFARVTVEVPEVRPRETVTDRFGAFAIA